MLAVVVIILVSRSEARRRGIDPGLVTSAIIVVAVFALIGARLYHVIDEWAALRGRSAAAPCCRRTPASGLYGGIVGAIVGIWIFVRGA